MVSKRRKSAPRVPNCLDVIPSNLHFCYKNQHENNISEKTTFPLRATSWTPKVTKTTSTKVPKWSHYRTKGRKKRMKSPSIFYHMFFLFLVDFGFILGAPGRSTNHQRTAIFSLFRPLGPQWSQDSPKEPQRPPKPSFLMILEAPRPPKTIIFHTSGPPRSPKT